MDNRIYRQLVLAVTVAAALSAAVPAPAQADAPKAKKSKVTPVALAAGKSGNIQLETYQNLILKAQNLTLQQDRLQTSQVLIRGIQRETVGSAAYKELVRALGDLSGVFYTEKAQSLFATAEAMSELRPREAIDQLQEALKIEDRNLTILNALARLHLRLDECGKAGVLVKKGQEVDPYSSEIRLLELQVLNCEKNFEALTLKLATVSDDLDVNERFARAIELQDLLRHKEPKKVKSFLTNWESQFEDDPEVYYWKWFVAKQNGSADHAAAAKYAQLCQNITPRKRKAFSLDVELCKQKNAIDLYLKDSANQLIPVQAPAGSAEDTKQ